MYNAKQNTARMVVQVFCGEYKLSYNMYSYLASQTATNFFPCLDAGHLAEGDDNNSHPSGSENESTSCISDSIRELEVSHVVTILIST